MRKTESYEVAGHRFSIDAEDDWALWNSLEEPYGPFRTDSTDGLLFSFRLAEKIVIGEKSLVFSSLGKVEPGFIALNISNCPEGYHIEFYLPESDVPNGEILVNDELSEVVAVMYGSMSQKCQILNTALNFSYMMCSASKDTLMVHASAVVRNGKSYLFLGKSGTGKSTHSRMWLAADESNVLMNDDHPVLRVGNDGTVTAYGSPWSGKTRCYKNMIAPIGAIVRISRALNNMPQRLSVIEAYASLMTSCSGMTWERRFADAKDRTLQKVVSSVPCWIMHCLPDIDAAHVCMAAVAK